MFLTYKFFLILQVEAEEQPEISEAYSVSAVPYFVFFKVLMQIYFLLFSPVIACKSSIVVIYEIVIVYHIIVKKGLDLSTEYPFQEILAYLP